MIWTILALAAGATLGAAVERPLWTVAAMRAAAPAVLGDALLPAGHPAIVRAEILPEARQIMLYAKPKRLDRGFCRAALFRVTLVPLEYATDPSPDGPRYRSGAVSGAAVHRVSAAPEPCEPDTRGYFPISGGSDVDGRALVRALIAAKAAAASGASIPPTGCVDHSGGDGCVARGRALLAGIRTDAIGNVVLTPCTAAEISAAKACGPQVWMGADGGGTAYWVAWLGVRGAGPRTSIARITLARERVAG